MSDRKRCTKCDKHKLLTEFSPCRNGVQPACRQCRNAAESRLSYPVSVAEKTCCMCQQTLDASAFYPNARKKDGLQSHCKECTKIRKRGVFYAVTLNEKTCKHCGEAKPAESFCTDPRRKGGLRSECRECCSILSRACVYKISVAQASAMCAVERCEICDEKLPTLTDRNLDHWHATGHMRGTLCCDCNKMLGCAKDKPSVLEKGAEYLIRKAAEAEGLHVG